MLSSAMERPASMRMAIEAMVVPAAPNASAPDAQRLRHRPDQIKVRELHEGDDRAGAENKHERDDRRRDQDGAANILHRRARFAREDGDVFETAERAERHFAEDVEAEERRARKRPFNRMIGGQV